MIETVDDIIEQLADQLGVYGAHREEECKAPDYCCRPCWTAHLKNRLLTAVEVERKLYQRIPKRRTRVASKKRKRD